MSDDGYSFTLDSTKRIAAVVRNAEGEPVDGTGRPATRRPGTPEHWGRITRAVRDGQNWAWKYDTEQVRQTAPGRDQWEAVEGGIVCSATDSTKPTAYNSLEEKNGTSGVMGNGVNVSTLPDGWEMKPIQNGTVHRMHLSYADDTATEYRFTSANGVDGQCQTGGT